MSRYFLQKEVPAGTACIAYGFDHALGYFYQEEHPGQKALVADGCSHFDGLTGVQLAERLVVTCRGRVCPACYSVGQQNNPTGSARSERPT